MAYTEIAESVNSYAQQQSPGRAGNSTQRSSYVGTLKKRREMQMKGETHQSTTSRLFPSKLDRTSLMKSNNNLPTEARTHKQDREGLMKTSIYSGLIPSTIDPAAEELQNQLDEYDKRLTVLRNQLRSSVDQSLQGARDVRPGEKKRAETVSPVESSVIQNIVTCTGQGCKEVVDLSKENKKNTTSQVWKTRPFKSAVTTSSCTMKLKARMCTNVTIRLTFSHGEAVPCTLLFEHAPKATAAFQPLGKVALQKKSMKHLKHVFRLGKDIHVNRYLRITCTGSISPNMSEGKKSQHGRYHAVSYLSVTGDRCTSSDSILSESNNDFDDASQDDEVEFSFSAEGLKKGMLEESSASGTQIAVQPTEEEDEPPSFRNPRHQKNVKKKPTVWERLSEVKGRHEDAEGDRPNQSVHQKVANASPEVPEGEKATLPLHPVLSESRQRLVEGVLQSLKLDPYQAASALKCVAFCSEADTVSGVKGEELEELLQCIPTLDEREKLEEIKSTGGSSDAEEFMLDILNIRNLDSKVKAHVFLSEFDLRASVAQDAANIISRACKEIEECRKLHLALCIVHKKGSLQQQRGMFDLYSLLKLKSDEGFSLLRSVAQNINAMEGKTRLPNILKEMPTLSTASQFSLEDIRSELQELADCLEFASNAWSEDEPGASFVDSKVDLAMTRLASTNAIVVESDADFIGAVSALGIDPTTIEDSSDLFNSIMVFCDEVNAAHLENMNKGFPEKNLSKRFNQSTTLDIIRPHTAVSKDGRQLMVDSKPTASAQKARQCKTAPSVSVQELLQKSKKKGVEQAHNKEEAPVLQADNKENGIQNDQIEENDVLDRVRNTQKIENFAMSSPVSQMLRSSRALLDSMAVPTERPAPTEKTNTQTDSGGQLSDGDDNLEINQLSRDSTPVADWKKSSTAEIKNENTKQDSLEPRQLAEAMQSTNPEHMEQLVSAPTKDDWNVDMEQEEKDTESLATSEENPVISGCNSPVVQNSKSSDENEHSQQTKEEMNPKEHNSNEIGKAEDETRSIASGFPQKERLHEALNLDLAAKLLANADRLKKNHRANSRSQSASEVYYDNLAMGSKGEMPVSHQVHTPGEAKTSAKEITQDIIAPVEEDLEASLTPEQTKAVQALGEVIRKSLPKFASKSPDQSSGLHLALSNLDLDKILATIIANAGNTPTGPLARGVRGGDHNIFNGEEADELRKQEKEKYACLQKNEERKSLLEPIVPAPLGMGVTVSKTVSHGISPGTIAKSLHSNMSTSSRATTRGANSGNSGTSAHKASNSNFSSGVHQGAAAHAKTSVSQQVKYWESKEEARQGMYADATPNHWAGKQEEEEDRFAPDLTPVSEEGNPVSSAQLYVSDTPRNSEITNLSGMGLRLSREDALRSSRENSMLAAERLSMWDAYKGKQ